MDTAYGLPRQRQHEFLLAMLDHQSLPDASSDELARHRACSFGQIMTGTGGAYYPRSFFASQGLLFFMARMDNPVGQDGQSDEHKESRGCSRRLFIISQDKLPRAFNGSSQSVGGWQVFEGKLSYENYLATAEYLPFMKPSSLRDKTTTIGCGDRPGASNPGHIRAAWSFDISPVLALPQTIQDRVLQDYAGKTFSLGDVSLTIPEPEAMRCALMYWKALDFTAEVDARLRSKRGDADVGKRFFRFLETSEELHYHCVASHLRRHIELLGVPEHA